MLLLVSLRYLGRALRTGWTEPEFRILLTSVALFIGLGTFFYSRVEGWSVLDSLYFVIVTMTTVGYGDLSPTTTASRIVTVVFILIGIGLFLAFATRVATLALSSAVESREKARQRKMERREMREQGVAISTRMAALVVGSVRQSSPQGVGKKQRKDPASFADITHGPQDRS